MIGQTLRSYRVLDKLGEGGMGEVYRATDTALEREVAIKVLPEEVATDADRVARFAREARLLASLNHPSIAHLWGLETVTRPNGSDVYFIVMELAEGEDLALRLTRGPVPIDEAVAIARQIADALEEAHDKGIVHRDLKPGNIKVTPDGKVKVLDFGLARRFKTTDTDELGPEGSTIPGRPMGTANYMAPERILQLPLDPRSDLFSLGVVIFEMATGRLPFAGASPSETVANVLDKEPVPLTSLAPQHPKGLEDVVRRLLSKKAGDRYPSANELTIALLGIGAPNVRGFSARLRRLFLGS